MLADSALPETNSCLRVQAPVLKACLWVDGQLGTKLAPSVCIGPGCCLGHSAWGRAPSLSSKSVLWE